jgi:hypothetical protein
VIEERSIVMSVIVAAPDSRPPDVENGGRTMELVLLSVKRGIECEEDVVEDVRLPGVGATAVKGEGNRVTLAWIEVRILDAVGGRDVLLLSCWPLRVAAVDRVLGGGTGRVGDTVTGIRSDAAPVVILDADEAAA